jgi:hypothetical protein
MENVEPLTEPPFARYTPRALRIGAAALGLAYAGFLARHLPPQVLDARDVGLGPAGHALYAALGATGAPLIVGRVLSVLCFAATVSVTEIFCSRVTGDRILGAILALIWLVFPPVVGIGSLATPYAIASALSMTAMLCLWPSANNTNRVDGFGAACLAVVALLDPLGAWTAIAIAFLLALMRRRIWPLLGPSLGAALAVLATVPVVDFDLPGVAVSARPVVDGALFPYGFLWVSCVLGAVCSRSKPVVAILGRGVILICRVAPVLYLGLVALQIHRSASFILVSSMVFLPLGLLGGLPLALWVRRVMPTVRNMAAWIAFPVILYCGFSLIMAPVKRHPFPFTALSHTQPR